MIEFLILLLIILIIIATTTYILIKQFQHLDKVDKDLKSQLVTEETQRDQALRFLNRNIENGFRDLNSKTTILQNSTKELEKTTKSVNDTIGKYPVSFTTNNLQINSSSITSGSNSQLSIKAPQGGNINDGILWSATGEVIFNKDVKIKGNVELPSCIMWDGSKVCKSNLLNPSIITANQFISSNIGDLIKQNVSQEESYGLRNNSHGNISLYANNPSDPNVKINVNNKTVSTFSSNGANIPKLVSSEILGGYSNDLYKYVLDGNIDSDVILDSSGLRMKIQGNSGNVLGKANLKLGLSVKTGSYSYILEGDEPWSDLIDIYETRTFIGNDVFAKSNLDVVGKINANELCVNNICLNRENIEKLKSL